MPEKKRSTSKKPLGRSAMIEGFRPVDLSRDPHMRIGVIAHYLENCRHRYYARGDKTALLEALEFCMFHDVHAPWWAAREFRGALGNWQSFKVATLDEAFGVQRPKRKRLAAERERQQVQFEVYAAVEHAVRDGAPRDDALFEDVGQKVALKLGLARPISATRVKEYLASARQELKAQNSRLKWVYPTTKTFIRR